MKRSARASTLSPDRMRLYLQAAELMAAPARAAEPEPGLTPAQRFLDRMRLHWLLKRQPELETGPRAGKQVWVSAELWLALQEDNLKRTLAELGWQQQPGKLAWSDPTGAGAARVLKDNRLYAIIDGGAR